ncbi:MAG: LrgB family protein [Nocardioides sp.]
MTDTWDWVRSSPLFVIALTLAAYQVGLWARDRTNGHPVAQPALVAIALVAAVITVVDIDYTTYRSGAELIAFLLGPATVALAIPLHRQLDRLRGLVFPVLAGVVLGALASIVTGVLLLRATGGDEVLERTMAAKASTTPVAIALTENLEGIGP